MKTSKLKLNDQVLIDVRGKEQLLTVTRITPTKIFLSSLVTSIWLYRIEQLKPSLSIL